MKKWVQFNYDKYVELGASANLRAGLRYPCELVRCDMNGDRPLLFVYTGDQDRKYAIVRTFSGGFYNNMADAKQFISDIEMEIEVEEEKPKLVHYLDVMWAVSYQVKEIEPYECVHTRMARTLYHTYLEAKKDCHHYAGFQYHVIVLPEPCN
jgi:hypothetical protein